MRLQIQWLLLEYVLFTRIITCNISSSMCRPYSGLERSQFSTAFISLQLFITFVLYLSLPTPVVSSLCTSSLAALLFSSVSSTFCISRKLLIPQALLLHCVSYQGCLFFYIFFKTPLLLTCSFRGIPSILM